MPLKSSNRGKSRIDVDPALRRGLALAMAMDTVEAASSAGGVGGVLVVVENPDDETFPGIVVLRLDGGLFFATSEALEDRVRAIGDGAHALVLSLEGVNFVDSQGSAKLAELHRLTQSTGMTLRLARLKPHVRTVLEADGVIDLIGADHIHGNVQRAVRNQLEADG